MLLSQLCFSFAFSQPLPVAQRKNRLILPMQTYRRKNGAGG